MDLGSIFLILGLLLLVGLFVAQPFLGQMKTARLAPASDSQDHELMGLLAERDRLINALQELDFDYTLGKIPGEDYPSQRAGLLKRGADVLRALDERLAPDAAVSAEDRLEAVIAARRADARKASGNGHGAAGVVVADDELEQLLATRRRERLEKAGGFCAKCGTPLQKSDVFCPRCGARSA